MITQSELQPSSQYTRANTFANAQTAVVDIDFRSTAASDYLLVQFAGRDGNWSQEIPIRQGAYTLRHPCEYFRFRTPAPSIGTPVLSFTMYSEDEVGPYHDTPSVREMMVSQSPTSFPWNDNVSQWGGTATSLGQKVAASSVPVTLASDQPDISVTAKQVTNPWIVSAAQNDSSKTGVSVGGLAGAGATLTLAASPGQFHYITHVDITAYATAAIAGGAAAMSVTSTNLSGNPLWNFPSAFAIGTTFTVILEPTEPLRSSVVGTATTFVMPAVGNIVWRANAFYLLAA